jgi:hypothetical protein
MPYFDDVVLTIAAEGDPAVPPEPDFSCDALGATLKPATTTTTRNYLCGTQTIVSDATWTLTLDFEQNYLPDGLSTYLFDHAGEKANVTIDATTSHQVVATCVATLVPSDFGGKAGEIAEATIDLGCDGQPTFTPAAVQAAQADAAGELEDVEAVA